MRCKCCNRVMRKYETSKYQVDGNPEDMCTRCVYYSFDYTVGENYEHSYVEDGITEIKCSEY